MVHLLQKNPLLQSCLLPQRNPVQIIFPFALFFSFSLCFGFIAHGIFRLPFYPSWVLGIIRKDFSSSNNNFLKSRMQFLCFACASLTWDMEEPKFPLNHFRMLECLGFVVLPFLFAFFQVFDCSFTSLNIFLTDFGLLYDYKSAGFLNTCRMTFSPGRSAETILFLRLVILILCLGFMVP